MDLRWAVYIRDAFSCAWCGDRCEDDQLTLDHIFPRGHRSRDNHPSRLTVACVSCNLSRKSTPLSPWLKRLRDRGTLDVAMAALGRRHARLDRKEGRAMRDSVRGVRYEEPLVLLPESERPWWQDEQGVCW